MSVEFDRVSPGKFDPRTLNRKTLDRWTGRSLELVSADRLYDVRLCVRLFDLSTAIFHTENCQTKNL